MPVVFNYLKISEYVSPFAQFVNATSYGTTATITQFTIDTPSGAQDGDSLIMGVIVGGDTVNTPSGWLLIHDASIAGTNSRSYVFGRSISGTPPANYTVTINSGTAPIAVLACYRNASYTLAEESVNGASANITAPSIDFIAPQTLVCIFTRDDNTNAITVPASMTQRAANTGGTGDGGRKIVLADEQIASAGATGTRVATSTGSTASYGVSIAL